MTTSTPSSRSEAARNASLARWAKAPPRPVVLGTRGHPVKYLRRYQLKRHAEGRCIECGKDKAGDVRRLCTDCRTRDALRRAKIERRVNKAEKEEQVKREMSRWSVF